MWLHQQKLDKCRLSLGFRLPVLFVKGWHVYNERLRTNGDTLIRQGRWSFRRGIYSATMDPETFSEGLAAMQTLADHRWGFIDKTGKWVINLNSDRGTIF